MVSGSGIEVASTYIQTIAKSVEWNARSDPRRPWVPDIDSDNLRCRPHADIQVSVSLDDGLSLTRPNSADVFRRLWIANVNKLHTKLTAGDEQDVARFADARRKLNRVVARNESRMLGITNVNNEKPSSREAMYA